MYFSCPLTSEVFLWEHGFPLEFLLKPIFNNGQLRLQTHSLQICSIPNSSCHVFLWMKVLDKNTDVQKSCVPYAPAWLSVLLLPSYLWRTVHWHLHNGQGGVWQCPRSPRWQLPSREWCRLYSLDLPRWRAWLEAPGGRIHYSEQTVTPTTCFQSTGVCETGSPGSCHVPSQPSAIPRTIQLLPAQGSAAENPEFLHLFISKFQWNTDICKSHRATHWPEWQHRTCHLQWWPEHSQVRSSLPVLCFGTKMWSWAFPRTIT